ncbi:MAG: NfeD family protein [Hyphomicrobiaceae bacterium]
MVDLFFGLGPWNWLILAALLFGLELIVPGVHFLWFGVAAVLVGMLALLTGLTWQWQLVAFAVLSVASVFMARRFSGSDISKSDAPDLNIRGAEYVGRVVPVEEAIRGGRGKVRVGDTMWLAEGPESPAGSRVRIKGVNGTVLVVERD